MATGNENEMTTVMEVSEAQELATTLSSEVGQPLVRGELSTRTERGDLFGSRLVVVDQTEHAITLVDAEHPSVERAGGVQRIIETGTSQVPAVVITKDMLHEELEFMLDDGIIYKRDLPKNNPYEAPMSEWGQHVLLRAAVRAALGTDSLSDTYQSVFQAQASAWSEDGNWDALQVREATCPTCHMILPMSGICEDCQS